MTLTGKVKVRRWPALRSTLLARVGKVPALPGVPEPGGFRLMGPIKVRPAGRVSEIRIPLAFTWPVFVISKV